MNNHIIAQGLTLPPNSTGFDDLNEFIMSALNVAIGAAAVVCVAVLIGSGYMYITASGDEAKVEKATKSLTFAIVGLAICFISVMLVNFVLKDLLGDAEVSSLMMPFLLT
jgi:TRAP-type C4-dicarboxylate transport system permease small subunit